MANLWLEDLSQSSLNDSPIASPVLPLLELLKGGRPSTRLQSRGPRDMADLQLAIKGCETKSRSDRQSGRRRPRGVGGACGGWRSGDASIPNQVALMPHLQLQDHGLFSPISAPTTHMVRNAVSRPRSERRNKTVSPPSLGMCAACQQRWELCWLFMTNTHKLVKLDTSCW